jgi:hypothetical protein
MVRSRVWIVFGYIPNVGAGFAAVVIDVRALREFSKPPHEDTAADRAATARHGRYPFYRHQLGRGGCPLLHRKLAGADTDSLMEN